jgi:hypothetical protein
MQTPLEIRFRQMDPSPAVEARIRDKATALVRSSDRITVERRHRHHRKGNLFRVSGRVRSARQAAGGDHAGPEDHADEGVSVAIRDAFDAAPRLEDHVRECQGKIKSHEIPLHGRCEGSSARAGSASSTPPRTRFISTATAWPGGGSTASSRAARSASRSPSARAARAAGDRRPPERQAPPRRLDSAAYCAATRSAWRSSLSASAIRKARSRLCDALRRGSQWVW